MVLSLQVLVSTFGRSLHFPHRPVHLSRSRAIHLFKETYGVTPYHYYLTQKGELACTLLKCTTLSIQEISEQLGFSDYHHFSGFFRKWYGVSPSGYR